MPWNGSDLKYPKKNVSSISKKDRPSKFVCKSFFTKKTILTIVSILIVLIVVVIISSQYFKESPSQKNDKSIPKVNTPRSYKKDIENISSLQKNNQKKKKYNEMSNEEKLKYYRDKYGENIPSNLKPIVYYLENPPKQNFKPNSRPESIFHNRSEREIAAFLLAEPGKTMVRPISFNDKFDENFKESLTKEIELLSEDSPDQRELKLAVIETKKELLLKLKEGKKPSEIMTEAANELYQLGQYRNQLEKEILAIKNDPSKSNQDLIETVMAANIMLKKKGLKPIRQPNLFIRNATLKKSKSSSK